MLVSSVPSTDSVRLDSASRLANPVKESNRGTAHMKFAHRHPQPTDTVCFQGEVLINCDGPFYEVHPTQLWFE